jgi:hypothetical protein
MTTIVQNLTKVTIASGHLNLSPYAQASLEVLTTDILNQYKLGNVSLSPTPESRVATTIVDNSSGVATALASAYGTIAGTALTLDQGVASVTGVVNVAFTANLVNVPVTFTGGTVTSGGVAATGLMSTGAGGTTATITMVKNGDYSAAPTGVSGAIGSGSWTSFTPVMAADIVGTLVQGHTISGPGITAGTYLVSGSGNSWVVSPSQTVSTHTPFTCLPGLPVIAAGASYSQADMVAIKLAISTINAQMNTMKVAIDHLNGAVAKIASGVTFDLTT